MPTRPSAKRILVHRRAPAIGYRLFVPALHGRLPGVAHRALLVVTDLLDMGPSRFVLDLAAELPRAGISARVFSIAPGDPRHPGSTPHSDPLVPVTYGSPPWWGRPYWFPTMVGRLVRAAAGTDVVVAGNEVGAGLVGAFLAGKATNKPVVAIAHRNLTASLDVVGGWEKRAAELIYPHLDGVVCVSRRVVPTAVALGVSARRLRVIPNGTDPQRLAALASAPPPEWLPDGTIVMGLGSLEKQKGFDLLIEAHARVRADGQPHQLVIVGEGPERESLESLVARLGLSDSVHLPGFLRNPFPILARASLCCVPSRFEGSPLVLPEALGLGVPVIAANCVSAPSEVLAGDAYWDLVEGDSADALASAIARHLDQPQRLASKAQAGREDSDAYSVRARAWNYASLFEKVLAHRIP